MAKITPNDGGAGGIFTPASVDIDDANLSASFTYKPAAGGASVIAVENDSGWADPESLAYDAIPIPLSVPGLQAWWDASTLPVVPDNTPIDQWDDSSGNGNHAIQTGAARPTYVSRVAALLRTPPEVSAKPGDERIDRVDLHVALSKPAVRFGNGSQFNLTTQISGAQPWTTFAVLYADMYFQMTTLGSIPGSYGGCGINLMGGSGATGYIDFNDGTNNWDSTQTLPANTFLIVSAQENAGTPAIFVNGVAQGASASGYAAGVNPFTSLGGGKGGDASQNNGYIAEFLHYNRMLTTAERQKIEQYLATKYGFLFHPAGVAGLTHWWSADSLQLNDGDLVANWPDLSGNGNNATQAAGLLLRRRLLEVEGQPAIGEPPSTKPIEPESPDQLPTPQLTAAQPTFKKNVLNGKPAVRFDGVNDFLTAPFVQVAAMTTLIVARVNVDAASQKPYATFVDAGDPNAKVGNWIIARMSGTNWGSYSAFGGEVTSGEDFNTGDGFAILEAYTGGYQSNIGGIYRNGILKGTINPANYDNLMGGVYGGTLVIGADQVAREANCDIAEILLYAGVTLTDPDRQAIENYLKTKYDIGRLTDFYQSASKQGIGLQDVQWQQLGQSFTSKGGTLHSVSFDFYQIGAATGTVYAKLYASTGGNPTGPLLAISEPMAAGSLWPNTPFLFKGANRYAMVNGTNYVIIVDATTVTGAPVGMNYDPGGGTHPGTMGGNNAGGGYAAWSAGYDLIFHLFIVW